MNPLVFNNTFDKALAQARLSQSKYRLGAVLVQGSQMWGGHNDMYKTHPLGLYLFENRWIQVGIHAEMEVLIQSKGKADGALLYVARLKRNGNLGMARPCRRCRYLIRKAGVKKVFYTTGEARNEFAMEYPYTW